MHPRIKKRRLEVQEYQYQGVFEEADHKELKIACIEKAGIPLCFQKEGLIRFWGF